MTSSVVRGGRSDGDAEAGARARRPRYAASFPLSRLIAHWKLLMLTPCVLTKRRDGERHGTALQCPHCKRLLTLPPEAKTEPWYFAKDFATHGALYRLPPFASDTLSGIGATASALTFGYYNLHHFTTIADRTLPAATSTYVSLHGLTIRRR